MDPKVGRVRIEQKCGFGMAPVKPEVQQRRDAAASTVLAVHGREKVLAGGQVRSPLVASGSPHLSLKHPSEVSLGR